MARRVLIDGIDTLLIDPRSTTGQPDGWGWDWERWRRRPHITIQNARGGVTGF